MLVVGSIRPWLERMVLARGAREVVTLEYRSIYNWGNKDISSLFNENYLQEDQDQPPKGLRPKKFYLLNRISFFNI